jgi:hypothetical protein
MGDADHHVGNMDSTKGGVSLTARIAG